MIFVLKVPVILYHGTDKDRNIKRGKLKRMVRVKEGVEVFPVIVTSYEVTMKDKKLLQHIHWKLLIVDEGHRIKNTQCRLIK